MDIYLYVCDNGADRDVVVLRSRSLTAGRDDVYDAVLCAAASQAAERNLQSVFQRESLSVEGVRLAMRQVVDSTIVVEEKV